MIRFIFILLLSLLSTTALSNPFDFKNLKPGADLIVRVDGLRVRAEPTLYSDIFTNLMSGDRVNYSGNIGKKEHPAILGGEKYQSPFIQVDCRDGKTGWVYAKGLLDLNNVKILVRVSDSFSSTGLFTFEVHNLSPVKFKFPNASVIVNVWNEKGYQIEQPLYKIGGFKLNSNSTGRPDKSCSTEIGICEFLDDSYIKRKADGTYKLQKSVFLPKIPDGSYKIRFIVQVKGIKSFYSETFMVNLPFKFKS